MISRLDAPAPCPFVLNAAADLADSPGAPLVARSAKLDAAQFGAVYEDQGIDPTEVVQLDPAPLPPSMKKAPLPVHPGPLLVGPIGAGMDISIAVGRFFERAGKVLPKDAPAMFFLKDSRPNEELARWRNELWPWLHVLRIYRSVEGKLTRETLQGTETLSAPPGFTGVVLATHTREHVLSPSFTVDKFDANAASWNGHPGTPGYKHFRWMRKYVALFAEPKQAAPASILDFGCGAGWVGIEAALAAGGGAKLRSFDPSPEMVRITGENAKANGIGDFEGRPGFGSAPPFEEPFDLVLSSGVVSFAPDTEAWLDGLAGTVQPGGTLVIGDINPESKGMARRRTKKHLLPARELNGQRAADIRAGLERRGFAHQRTAGYQLTRPIPEAMHVSNAKLGGVLTPLLLAWNRARAGGEQLSGFDSWVMRFTRES